MVESEVLDVMEEDESPKRFNIRLEARLKNADLVSAREQLGLTAREVAEKIGISYPTYLGYEGMRSYPSPKTQEKICDFYRGQGIFLFEDDVFPEEISGLRMQKMVTERAVPVSQLISLKSAGKRHLLPPVTFERELEGSELREELEKILPQLGHREEKILRMYYGLDGDEPMTYEEIGKRLLIHRERVRQIYDVALTRIRGGYDWKGTYRGNGIGRHLEIFLENLTSD